MTYTRMGGSDVTDRTLGLSSVVIAAAIPMFIVLFGLAAAAGMPAAAQSDPRLAATFFHDHLAYAVGLFVNSIVMHVAVVVLTVGLFARLRSTNDAAAIGAVFGIAWAVLDITQSSIAYAAMVGSASSEAATVDAIAKAIQNAAHLGGGIWVLSIAFTAGSVFSRAHRSAAAVVGAIFALHILIVPLVPAWWTLEYVGLPIFFCWTATALLRSGVARQASTAAKLQQA
jgi:hypothetical protein